MSSVVSCRFFKAEGMKDGAQDQQTPSSRRAARRRRERRQLEWVKKYHLFYKENPKPSGLNSFC